MYKNGEKGRSMIEMLGVLAIIAVLTVGGIAGYSKAMMKYKINKMISEYNYLIVNSLEYKDSLLKNNPKTDTIYLSSFFQDVNIVPSAWVMNGSSLMIDSVGNNVQPYLNNDDGAEFIVMNVYLRTTSQGTADFAYNSCIALFNDIAKPLSQYFLGIFANSGSTSIHYNGTSSCHNEKNNFRCLTDMTLADADEACKKCLKTSNNCQVVMVW